jgi:predicted RNase H-like HicB family nuclease
MTRNYNLSLIFYPQLTGGYTVICPELRGVVTEGDTLEDAMDSARELIADMLPDEIKSEVNAETLREGLCMEGKLYREINVSVGETGEVVFPSADNGLRVAV